MLLDKFSYQMMKVSDFLIRSREGMINNEMDFGRVPNPRDTHLTKHFNRKWPSAVLSHSEVHRQYSNVSRAMNLLDTIGSDANDLLAKGQRIIVQDVLMQLRSEAGGNWSLLNVNVEPRH